MKSIFEKMGVTYRQKGDYFLPNLSLPPNTEAYQIGKYGRLRRQYLEESCLIHLYDGRRDALETSC